MNTNLPAHLERYLGQAFIPKFGHHNIPFITFPVEGASKTSATPRNRGGGLQTDVLHLSHWSIVLGLYRAMESLPDVVNDDTSPRIERLVRFIQSGRADFPPTARCRELHQVVTSLEQDIDWHVKWNGPHREYSVPLVVIVDVVLEIAGSEQLPIHAKEFSEIGFDEEFLRMWNAFPVAAQTVSATAH